MAMGNSELGRAVLLTSSNPIAGGTAMARTYPGGGSTQAETTALQGAILGFYVNNTSSLTMTISAGTASGGTALTGTITPAIGFHRFPLVCESGLFFNVGSGSGSVTFFVVE